MKKVPKIGFRNIWSRIFVCKHYTLSCYAFIIRQHVNPMFDKRLAWIGTWRFVTIQCCFDFLNHQTKWQGVPMPTPGEREGVSGFCLRTEQGNKLPFDNISPEDKWRGRIPLRLSKAVAFWQYQSMWQRVIWTSQICCSECQGSTRTKPLVSTKMQVIDTAFGLRTHAIKNYAVMLR